jgi:hypothetical protein|uniref:hypothetical protein n=1 Tax=Cephaloticoccus sp. TaxID=1985742 RepID=UPI00404ABA03
MKPYLRVSLGYLVFGVVWILVSDQLANWLAGSLTDLSYFQTVKGLIYVGLSALLIAYLTRQAFQKERRQLAEKEAVFRKTIEGSHHILHNYLNQMQLVTLEAEGCVAFDRKTLNMARDVTARAEAELNRLTAIDNVTPEHIDSIIYRDLRKS